MKKLKRRLTIATLGLSLLGSAGSAMASETTAAKDLEDYCHKWAQITMDNFRDISTECNYRYDKTTNTLFSKGPDCVEFIMRIFKFNDLCRDYVTLEAETTREGRLVYKITEH